jgi:hypothetical protein
VLVYSQLSYVYTNLFLSLLLAVFIDTELSSYSTVFQHFQTFSVFKQSIPVPWILKLWFYALIIVCFHYIITLLCAFIKYLLWTVIRSWQIIDLIFILLLVYFIICYIFLKEKNYALQAICGILRFCIIYLFSEELFLLQGALVALLRTLLAFFLQKYLHLTKVFTLVS